MRAALIGLGLALATGCAAQESAEPPAQRQQPLAVCGNGIHEVGEQCDDGELNSDSAPDACRTSCRTPYCGDDVVDTGEDCDDGANDDADFCRPDCTPNVCGDENVNAAFRGETCDDGGVSCTLDCLQDLSLCGNNVLDPGEGCDLAGLNSDAPNADCRTNCQVARCGDGVVDDDPDTWPPEECDRDDGCGPDCTWL